MDEQKRWWKVGPTWPICTRAEGGGRGEDEALLPFHMAIPVPAPRGAETAWKVPWGPPV